MMDDVGFKLAMGYMFGYAIVLNVIFWYKVIFG